MYVVGSQEMSIEQMNLSLNDALIDDSLLKCMSIRHTLSLRIRLEVVARVHVISWWRNDTRC